MTKILGLEFAPLNIPLARRIQTLVVIWYVLVFTLWPYTCIAFILGLLFTRFYWISLIYIAWVFYDVVVLETSSHGGRRSEWFRNAKIWHYFRDYFPAELVKTHDLDPDRNYIMGYHPHGIIGCGCMANFATESTGFSKKFPGITVHQLTLKSNFSIPLLRECLLSWGMCDVSKDGIRYLMTKAGKGRAAVIVVGGAEEALEAHPGVYRLTMKRRKGFIRIAIQTGADLVPIYSFGENDLFHQADNPQGSRLRQFQEKVKRVTGIAPPVFYGRGVFNYTFGFLPFRNPIHTVVGAPIQVEQHDNPPQELVDEYHTRYLQGLTDVFNQNKEKYGIDKDKVLEFL